MANRTKLAWAQLRVGLLVVVSLTIFALLVFLVSGQGLLTRKYSLRAYLDDAGGLKTGDPVRLAGIDAGNVENIRISASHDPQRSVEVTMKVQKKYQPEIRTDSEITLAAEGLLGQRFLDITRGSPNQPVIPEGGEVKVKETAELADVVSTSADVMTNLNRIATRVDHIMAQVESGKGSLGKIIYDESLYTKANKAVDDIQGVIAYATSGKGSLGKLLVDDEFYNTALGTMQKADKIVDDVQAGKGSLGQFLANPELYNRATGVITRADNMIADVQAGKGSLGKFVKDESLYNRANSTIENLNKISGRLERGEGTAGRLLHDPTLYNNMNNFSLDLRGLIADFRANPKKFLTIHFKVF